MLVMLFSPKYKHFCDLTLFVLKPHFTASTENGQAKVFESSHERSADRHLAQ